MDDLLMMRVAEPFVSEDLEITTVEIFREIHPEGQQTSMVSSAAEREEVEPEITMANEVIEDRGQRRNFGTTRICPQNILLSLWRRCLHLLLISL